MRPRSAENIPSPVGAPDSAAVEASCALPDDLPEQSRSALHDLLEQQLRLVASHRLRRERAGHVLQTTALLNEAYLRLSELRDPPWTKRSEFLAAASRTIRRILIDHARAAAADKRGGGAKRLSLDGAHLSSPQGPIDFLELNDAIEQLAVLAPRHARGVELRFFAGLSEPEIAEQLGVSRRTVQADWRLARAWLRRALGGNDSVPRVQEAV